MIGEAKDALFAAGLNQAQFDTVMALDSKRLEAGAADQDAKFEAEKANAEKALQTKWGDAYDSKLHLAQRLLKESTTDENFEEMTQAIGNNPLLIELLATAGEQLLEASSLDSEGQTSTKLTPAMADSRMKELIAERLQDPDIRWKNPEKYKRLSKEIDSLAEAAMAGQSLE